MYQQLQYLNTVFKLSNLLVTVMVVIGGVMITAAHLSGGEDQLSFW